MNININVAPTPTELGKQAASAIADLLNKAMHGLFYPQEPPSLKLWMP